MSKVGSGVAGVCLYTNSVSIVSFEESREKFTRNSGLVIRSRCRWGKCG